MLQLSPEDQLDHHSACRRQPFLYSTPVIGAFLVAQVTHASYVGRMTVVLCPRDCFFLRFESSKYVIAILDNVVVYMTSFGPTLWPCFDKDGSHVFLKRFGLTHC